MQFFLEAIILVELGDNGKQRNYRGLGKIGFRNTFYKFAPTKQFFLCDFFLEAILLVESRGPTGSHGSGGHGGAQGTGNGFGTR